MRGGFDGGMQYEIVHLCVRKWTQQELIPRDQSIDGESLLSQDTRSTPTEGLTRAGQ